MADKPFWEDDTPPAAPQSQLSTTDLIKALLGYGVRVAGPAVGAVGGGALGTLIGPEGTVGGAIGGGALGGALSEALVEKFLEPKHEVNLGRVGVAGVLGGVPGSWMVRSGKPLVSAAIGAGLGYAGVAGNKIAEGEPIEKSINPLEWSGMEQLSPVIGAGAGAAFSKIGGPKSVTTPAKEPLGFISKTGETEGGNNIWTVTPAKKQAVDKSLALNPESASKVQASAETATLPAAKRIAKSLTDRSKGSLRTATQDTRLSTTSSVNPLKPIENVAEGPGYSVPEPEHASVQDLVDALTENRQQGHYDPTIDASAIPEAPSEATLAALNKPANQRMGATAITKARTAEGAAVRQEAQADLQGMRDSLGGTSTSQIEQGAAKAQEQANQLKLKETAAQEVEAAKEGLVAQEPTVTERVTAGEGPYKSSKTTRFAPPKPEEGEAVPTTPAEPPKVYTVDAPPTKDVAAQRLYTNIKVAKAHGKALGADDILQVPGGYRLVFNDANLGAQGPKGTSFGTLDSEQEADALDKVFKSMGWGEVPKDEPKWGKVRTNLKNVTQEFTPTEGETLADFQKRSSLPFSKAKKILDDFKGQTGEIDPALMAKILSTGVGAAAGAAMNKEDRLKGALMGGALGLGVGLGAPALLKGVDTSNIRAMGRKIPDFYRGGLLSHPLSIAYNAAGGPWGSQFFGGAEHALASALGEPTANPAGGAIMRDALNVPKWLAGLVKQLPEAAVESAERERAETGAAFGNTLLEKAYKVPGVTMMAGDMNTRANLERFNIPEPLAREITLTNEPGQKIPLFSANWGKTPNKAGQRSILGQLMFPFKRTLLNIAESGVERTPGLGELVNLAKDPSIRIPAKMRVAQQSIGGSVLVMSYMAGASTPEGVGKQLKLHSLVSNLGGQYAALASLGFAMGQAHRTGKKMSQAALTDAISGLPLPSSEPLQDIFRPLFKLGLGEPLSRKELLPKSAVPKVLTLMFGAIPQGESQPEAPSSNSTPSSGSTFELK
jgi:hypothetical protein